MDKNHSCVFFFFGKIEEKEVNMKLKEIKEMIEHLKKILDTLDKIYQILNQNEDKEKNNGTS